MTISGILLNIYNDINRMFIIRPITEDEKHEAYQYVVNKIIPRVAMECYQQGVIDAQQKPFVLETEQFTLIGEVVVSVIRHEGKYVSEHVQTEPMFRYCVSSWNKSGYYEFEYFTKEEAEASRAKLIAQLKGASND